jgi:mRNA interferase RelE/StbE
MTYQLKVHRDIEKQLKRIPKKFRDRLIDTMRSLRDIPRPDQSTHLDSNLYRIRVGQYRIIYAIFEDELVIFVCKTARRSETTYREIKSLLERASKEVKGK